MSGYNLKEENYILVAAIDFGTTFSGYAFSLKYEPNNIMMNKNWGGSLGFQSYKTPTCVLTGSEHEFVAFGYEAEERYSQMEEDGESCFLYRHFKMMLHQDEDVNRNSTIKSTNGNEHAAMDIFVMAIEYLKKHLLSAVANQVESPPSARDIKWVLTVPAIWSEGAKQFMREAAFRAGCIDKKDSDMLVIALEPEAASIHCRSLPIEDFKLNTGGKPAKFKAGTKYLVIDAGGGTIDITAHEVLQTGGVKELHIANGGPWGGTRVDENFVTVLEKILGNDFIQMYQMTNSNDFLKWMTSFEKMKRDIKPDGNSKIRMQLNWSLASKLKETTGDEIDVAMNKFKEEGFSFLNGSFVLNHKKSIELFSEVVNKIAQHVEELLQNPKLSGISHILLVGGFGESEVLQKAIKNVLPLKTYTLIVPNEAQLAVVKGAVKFGFSPNIIESRIAKCSYGIAHSVPYTEGVHEDGHKIIVGSEAYCQDVFFPFIRKDEPINVGSSKKYVFSSTAEDGEDEMDLVQSVRLFSSPESHFSGSDYVTDDIFDKLGIVDISVPNEDTTIEVEIQFGGTEIKVQAKDLRVGQRAEATFDILDK